MRLGDEFVARHLHIKDGNVILKASNLSNPGIQEIANRLRRL